MRYYTIFKSNELNVIGEYPQVQKIEDYNLSLPNSYHNVFWDKFPDFEPNYEIKIKDKATPTNLLHSLSGFVGLTVDEKLKTLLERFNLPPTQFYPIEVLYKNEYLRYYWFHFVNSFLDYIDFEKTTFERFQKSKFKILEEFKVSSMEEFHRLKKELNFEKGIRLKKLVLTNSFPNYDVINLRNITPLTLVSEKLKKELEKSDFNGFEFSEYKPLITSQKPI